MQEILNINAHLKYVEFLLHTFDECRDDLTLGDIRSQFRSTFKTLHPLLNQGLRKFLREATRQPLDPLPCRAQVACASLRAKGWAPSTIAAAVRHEECSGLQNMGIGIDGVEALPIGSP